MVTPWLLEASLSTASWCSRANSLPLSSPVVVERLPVTDRFSETVVLNPTFVELLPLISPGPAGIFAPIVEVFSTLAVLLIPISTPVVKEAVSEEECLLYEETLLESVVVLPILASLR